MSSKEFLSWLLGKLCLVFCTSKCWFYLLTHSFWNPSLLVLAMHLAVVLNFYPKPTVWGHLPCSYLEHDYPSNSMYLIFQNINALVIYVCLWMYSTWYSSKIIHNGTMNWFMQVEWSGGTDTMDEALGKIHLREAAAVKRERAMAYAFSHQVSQHLSILFKITGSWRIKYKRPYCSGGPLQILIQTIMDLANLSGVGAWQNAGLQLDHGKAEPSFNQVLKKQWAGNQARMVKTRNHQQWN